MYSYKNISKNEEQFRKATGLSVERFNVLLESLNPGEDCYNIKLHDTKKRLNEEKFTNETLEYKESRLMIQCLLVLKIPILAQDVLLTVQKSFVKDHLLCQHRALQQYNTQIY